MPLDDDIETLLVVGNSVAVTLRFQPGTDYAGVVAKVSDGEFELTGEILNPHEHFGNASADPIFRIHRFKVADIASIRRE
jgi:hypothetical protein